MRVDTFDSEVERLVLEFKANPAKAVAYINAALDKGSHDEAIFASDVINDAFGGFSELAKRTEFDLYGALKKLITITDRQLSKVLLNDLMAGVPLNPMDQIDRMQLIYR